MNQPAPRPRNAWHSHLPRWILDHPAYDKLRKEHVSTLQAIANDCRPDDDGNLTGCFGGLQLQHSARVSARTLTRHLAKLTSLGFVVPTFVATNKAMKMARRPLCNIYGIPGKPGGLESKRAHKQVRVYTRRDDGQFVTQHLESGQQAEMFHQPGQDPGVESEAPGHKTQGTTSASSAPNADSRPGSQQSDPPPPEKCPTPPKCPTPSVNVAEPLGQNGRPHNPCVTSRYKNHGSNHGGGDSKSGGRGAGKPRCPHVTTADLRDTGFLVELHAKCEHLRLDGTDGERGLLWIVSAAERALEVGDKPAAMFAAMINRHLWINVTQAQEERARVRLAEHLHPPVWDEVPEVKAPRLVPRACELSADAKLACSAMKLAKGDAEDAFRLLQGKGERTGDAWSRDRWEAAAAEAGLRLSTGGPS